MEREVAWNHYSEEEKKKVFEFAEEYRKFISACKTERECVRTFVERAEAAGYLDIKKVIAEGIKLESGARVYADNVHCRKETNGRGHADSRRTCGFSENGFKTESIL